MGHLDSYISSTHKKLAKKAEFGLRRAEELLGLNEMINTVPLFELSEEDFFTTLRTTTDGPYSQNYKRPRIEERNTKITRNEIRRVLKKLFDLQARIQR